MQEIKYQRLQSDDNAVTPQESNLDENGLTYCLEQCKRHLPLKFLLICLVIVKAIYLINNFENFKSMAVTENNRTDIRIANETNLFGANSVCVHNSFNEDVHSVTFPQDQTRKTNTFATTISDFMVVSTTKVKNHGNINVTNQMATASVSALTPTTINLKNNFHGNETLIEESTTEFYANKSLHTTQTFADLQTTNIQTKIMTTTIKPFASWASKTTPAVVQSSSKDDKKYFINTSKCHIPFVEPFTPEIRKIFKPQHSTGCTTDQPIVTSSFNEHESRYILHINFTIAERLRKRSKSSKLIEEDLSCCYQEIVRSGSGSNVDKSFK